MKVTLLIAVMLASAVLAESYAVRRRFQIIRRRWYHKQAVKKTFEYKEEALQDTAAKLEEVVHDAENKVALDLIKEFKEAGEDNDVNGDTFENKVATLQEAAADMEEKVNEVEEDDALGLLEEELEELEEELEEAKGEPDDE